jgi:hypothetical protein
MMEGPGADSEEKHEPVSDIDTAVVLVGLKALDPEWPIREAIDQPHVVSVGRIVKPWDQELEGHRPDYWPMVRRTLFSGRVLLDDSLSW